MSELKTNLEQILQEKNEKIISQNIKKDVEVLGVTGSYDKEDIKELQDELADAEQELADVRRDLDNSTATISGSGENVTLNGTAEARFKKAPLPLGNTEQEVIEAQAGTTVEGENISASGVDLSKVEILNINGNTKQETTTGKNKITELKSIGNNLVEYFLDKNISNSFIMSGLSNLTVSGFKVTIKTSNGDIDLGYKSIEVNKNFSFTFSITTDDLSKIQNSTSTPFIQFWSSDGFAEADFKNVMIRDSSITDDTYEPYTGGIASPNPDYPQEIENVGDNVNLLDISQVMIGKAWNNASNNARAVVYMKCDPSTAYTISFNNISNFDGVYNFEKTSPEDTTAIVGVSQITTTKTITTNANSSYLGIQFNKSSISASDFVGLKIKIEKGDRVTAYSEYNQGNMGVEISNKNLFDKTIADVVEGYFNSSGEVVLGGTSSVTRGYIPIIPNTDMVLSGMPFTVYAFYDENKNFIERIIQGAESYTFNKNARYMRFQGYTADFDIDSVQLEQGSTATTYVAHEGQSFTIPTQAPFRKINDTKDTFIKKVDGKWYEKHVIGVTTYTGANNEVWTIYQGILFIDNENIKGYNGNLLRFLTNYFIPAISKCYIGHSTYQRLHVVPANLGLTSITNVAEWKTWLSTHNLVFQYELAEPTYIECTQEQTAILEQINTFYETTNIFSADEVSPNFTFTYNKVYASPSPDDESFIQTVSGDVEVLVQNKNLFDWDKIVNLTWDIASGTLNETLSNGAIVTGDTSASSQASAYSKGWFRPGSSPSNQECSINVMQNSNIVISADVTLLQLGYSNEMFIYLFGSTEFIDATKDSLILNQKIRVNRMYRNVPKGTYYPVFTLSSNKVKIENIQIELNTVATEYVEHREQVLPLTLKSKNLFDKTRIISTNQGNWEVVQITDGVRIIHKNSYYTGTPKVIFKLKPNTTYTYSQNEAAGYSIQPDGGTKQYANTNQMTVTTRPFRNINYRICCS